MSLANYQAQLVASIPTSPRIREKTIQVQIFSENEGRIEIALTMADGSELHLAEYVNLEKDEPIRKYSYHFQDKNQALIFRYDNKPHFRDLPTFPHHRHGGAMVQAATRPAIADVIAEALRIISFE